MNNGAASNACATFMQTASHTCSLREGVHQESFWVNYSWRTTVRNEESTSAQKKKAEGR